MGEAEGEHVAVTGCEDGARGELAGDRIGGAAGSGGGASASKVLPTQRPNGLHGQAHLTDNATPAIVACHRQAAEPPPPLHSAPLKGLARCQGICSTANGVGMPLVAEHLLDARDTIVKDTTIRASGLPTAPRFGNLLCRVSLFDKPD